MRLASFATYRVLPSAPEPSVWKSSNPRTLPPYVAPTCDLYFSSSSESVTGRVAFPKRP